MSEAQTALVDTLAELKRSVNLSDEKTSAHYEDNIADIISFCYAKDLLDLDGANFHLHPAQEIILKSLYMGSIGNRNLALTQDEWAWLETNSMYGDTNVSIEKLRYRERMRSDPKFRFTELTLVLGRRSGKTLIASIIAAYEAYKLLTINKGDPHTYYDLPLNKQIYILNVATALQQAGELFNELKSRLAHSPFFRNRIEHDTESVIRLFTDRDLRQRQQASTNMQLQGSVVIMCGHRNYKSMLGKAAIVVIFDELSFYDEGQKVSGTDFYNHLKPSISQFDRKGDGLLVEISSPGPRGGIMHRRSEVGRELSSTTMLFRMPTWVVNPSMPETNRVLAECKAQTPEMYNMLYGAEWPEGGASSLYFVEPLIKRALDAGADHAISADVEPRNNADYYAHIDPAISGDNYALVIVRRVMYGDSGGMSPRAILSFVKTWRPVKGLGHDLIAIERDIVQICKRFHVVSLSYDQFASASTLAVLRRNGINTVQTPFNRGYKNKIYQNLRDLMSKEQCGLWLFPEPQLLAEMRNLRQKPLQHSVWIGADPRSDVPTDDTVDCLAGAAFMSCGNYYKRWPGSIVASAGFR